MNKDDDWIRREEIENILIELKNKKFSKGLEIGAGNGFQSRLIKNICKKLFVTEYNEKRLKKQKQKNVQYYICDAEDLPFKDNSFDFIFSSNVLEHIVNRDKALSELKRVSRLNSLMIHIMPSRAGKLSQMFFYYINIFELILSKKKRQAILSEKKRVKDENLTTGSNIKRQGSRNLISCVFPAIHGEYDSHFEEFIEFGKKKWRKKFLKNNFQIIKIVKMPFYFNKGYDHKFLRKLLNKIGFCSSYAYFVKPKK